MRLTHEEKSAIVETIAHFDPEAKVYLFGSRVDDNQKVGDIDMLFLLTFLTFKDKLKIRSILFQTLEEQKIDLLIAKDSSDPFVKIDPEHGTPLN